MTKTEMITTVIACTALILSIINTFINLHNYCKNKSKLSATIYRRAQISQGLYEFIIEITNSGRRRECIKQLNIEYYKRENKPIANKIYNITIEEKQVKEISIELSLDEVRIIKQMHIVDGDNKKCKIKGISENMKIF